MTVEALRERVSGSQGRRGSPKQRAGAWPKAPEKLQFSLQEEQEPVMEAAVTEPAFEWERFGSFTKMIPVLSYCLRWKKRTIEEILIV